MNAYVAFRLAYSGYIVTNGFVEFKYRKDTKKNFSLKANGIFKFIVNGKEILTDSSLENSGEWTVFKYELAEPGLYTFDWVYSKYQEKDVSEFMKAEI
jgi:hypothetical protein